MRSHGIDLTRSHRPANTNGRQGALERWRETATAIVLASAGLLTSFAGYQEELWSARQFAEYSRSDALRVEASSSASKAATVQAVEVSMLTGWIEAKAAGDERLADFYQARLPGDLRGPFREWAAQRPMDNPGAASSPYVLPSYRPSGLRETRRLEAEADSSFRSAVRAVETAHGFDRAGVILASAMFFAGIGQLFTRFGARLALSLVAVTALVLGILQLFSLPMLSLGLHL